MQIPPLEEMQRNTGRVVMHCAELEWLAYAAVLQLSPNTEGRELAGQDFQPRVTTLRQLSQQLPDNEHRTDWLRLWEKVLSLIQDRNAILHNPLMIDVLQNDAGEIELQSRIHVFHKRRPQVKPLTPAYIQQTAEKAEQYSASALRLWGQLFPGASLFEHDEPV